MHRGRNTLVVSFAVVVALALVASPAGASRGRSKGSYCRTLAPLMNSDVGKHPSPRQLHELRRQAKALTKAPPPSVKAAASTARRLIVRQIDHWPARLSAADQETERRSLIRLLGWGVRHCSKLKPTAGTSGQPSPARRVQSVLRNGITNAKAIYTDTDSYLAATAATLHVAEPSVDFTPGPNDPANHASVSVHVVDAQQIVMAAGTGTTCYFIRDSATGYGIEFAQAPGTSCDAAAPPMTWQERWT